MGLSPLAQEPHEGKKVRSIVVYCLVVAPPPLALSSILFFPFLFFSLLCSSSLLFAPWLSPRHFKERQIEDKAGRQDERQIEDKAGRKVRVCTAH